MGTKGTGTELNVWLELDLTAAAARGELRPAFEIEALLEQVVDVIESGRHLILVGESGVGKTALIHELVRRLPGQGPAALRDKRVLQLSFARRVAGLEQPDKMRPAMQKLVEELCATPGVVPFFRDVHLAAPYSLEAQLLALLLGTSTPVLAEGDRQAVAAMLEDEPDLAQQCVVLEIEEPSLDRTLPLLSAWATAQTSGDGPAFESEALVEAAYLAHRFLARARLPRKALNLLSEVSSLLGGRTVTRTDVIERFCRAHRVPPLLVDPSVPVAARRSSQPCGRPGAGPDRGGRRHGAHGRDDQGRADRRAPPVAACSCSSAPPAWARRTWRRLLAQLPVRQPRPHGAPQHGGLPEGGGRAWCSWATPRGIRCR